MGTQIISTGVYGPLPTGTFGLILGRAKSLLTGLHVHPGVLDADYQGEIKLLVSSPQGPLCLNKGQRLAQLILLPLFPSGKNVQKIRGNNGFGSSDAYWVQSITEKRPTLKLKLDGKTFLGLIDTGADATVLSKNNWPLQWPLNKTVTHLRGIGQTTDTLQSAKLLTWSDEEGNQGTVQPFVIPDLPVNLWGRDILSQLNLIMCSPNEIVSQQMLSQGFLPGQGLGKNSQGIKFPPVIPPKYNRQGLGLQIQEDQKNSSKQSF